MTSIVFYNVNNLFLRYRFGTTYPGDMSGASAGSDPSWGFLPINNPGMFEPFNPEQTALAAQVLSENGLPDILCLCEVESLQALRLFNDFFLGSHYPYALLVDSYDFRQIDVGILSTKEILAVRTHVDDLDPVGRRLFSRDCLEVTIGLNPSGSRRLYLFINHLKSKFTSTDNPAETERSDRRRFEQAQAVVQILHNRFSPYYFNRSRFIVLGDLNDQPLSPWIAPLVQDASLYNTVDGLPENERWTHLYKSRNRASQLDYMLLSPALAEDLLQRSLQPVINRRGLGFDGYYASGNRRPQTTRIFLSEDDPNPRRINFGFPRFDLVEQTGQHASDHCPIYLELPI
jgi:endonuclease/exonuclease/phosphatase family metal-dependent hydrolase